MSNKTKPNIVMMVADDMGYGDFGKFNNGFLINGSLDSLNYLKHNGGLDFFGNSVSHHSPSNIGAFNGSGPMDVLNINLKDIKIYPSVTNDYVNISTQEFSKNIMTKIYAINGNLICTQRGKKLSFKNLKPGVYICLVFYGESNKSFKVVKL